ncbi:9227_t:CDS:2 [Dentiscutata erythropus]|uniref:Oxidoreductase NAD-binding domain-containing protein 1 n=1 Tax=Dentiscutata erythropus TaxID=1348616 RepID=A0A9N9FBH1_9GLOM|nr:9227_t:CDS:2 [Dentiscutata erythropus]
MAGEIISSVFIIEVPLTLNATFSNLNDSSILVANPSRFIPLISEDGVPRLYPQSLVKQFKFDVHPEFSNCDIYAQFNSGVNFWFNGDGPISPAQHNIHTVILHELFHGLGFTSAWRNHIDTILQYPTNALSPVPYLIYKKTNNLSSNPIIFQGFIETIFDKFLVVLPDDKTLSPLISTSLSAYTSKLNEFGPPPTEFSTPTTFAESLIVSPQWKSVAPLMLNKSIIANTLVFLPRGFQLVNGTYLETSLNPYISGSSISHVSYDSYTNSQDFLMRCKLEPGFTISDLISKGGNYQNGDNSGAIGPRLRSIMESMGYKTQSNSNPIIPKIPSSDNMTILPNLNVNITFQGPPPPINSYYHKVSGTNRFVVNSFTIWNATEHSMNVQLSSFDSRITFCNVVFEATIFRVYYVHRLNRIQRFLKPFVSKTGDYKMSEQQNFEADKLIEKPNHLERTSHIERQKSRIPAEIISIISQTPTIKSFLFRPPPSYIPEFSFLPGQWLDVFIPNVPIVGGFSLTSTPHQYTLTNTFELSIKYSTNPPAKWFHENAKIGDNVEVRVGGDFVWDERKEQEDGTECVLFIAGGVGINPLISMFTSILEAENNTNANDMKNQMKKVGVKKIRLLYSARSFNELLFYNRIEKLRKEWPQVLECKYFLTGENAPPSQSLSISDESEFYYGQRISQKILGDIIMKECENLEKLKCFICGPPIMRDNLICWLKNVGLVEKRILIEKW